MHKKSDSESGISSPRIFLAFFLCSAAGMLAMLSFAAPAPAPVNSLEPSGAAITFGHPVISGIGGTGFEQDLRLDPSNPARLYTSVPGTLSADTSWIWRSLDTGKTFKWVPGATALEGKVTTCHGGGDTELAVDSGGRLYFNDLTLANFSTARSDDQGATFTCSNTGVPDTAVDRQWYAIDGDPTNGGSIYLVNDEIGPGGAMCGTSTGNNLLVMYRSPVGGAGATAGIAFGPANKITAPLSCDEAIMGNNEVSPVATTLGQPNGLGGFATLPTPVKHVFVVHDNAQLNKILVGRCFPVAFGPPVPNVSDPSGLNCTDIVVADLGAGFKTGGNFPTMAIDNAGNLYTVWEQAPIDASGMVTGDTVLKYSYSTDQGNTWAAPISIDTSGSPFGTLHTNVFAWVVAGDDGRVNIAWYGTPGAPTFPSAGPDSCPLTCAWSLWMVQTLNGHAAVPTFSAPVQASSHFIHRGSIQTLIGGQTGDRTLGDFLQIRMGALGEAQIAYADSNNINEAFAPHAMYVRQNGGNGLLAASSPLNIAGLAPFNSVSDPTGDGKYEVNGGSSANMPQLDIVSSSITQVTTAPCSTAEPCYKIVMQLNDLSLAPTTAQDPDPDLVWHTQWLVPSATDSTGGKNFHAYAESLNGAPLQCFTGENAVIFVGGGVSTTYPGGATALPAANCQSTLGPNGTITIFVPLSNVTEPNPIDSRLHEVTASTMTLQQPANSVPPFGGIGGSLFNLIDVAQGYVFEPSGAPPTPTPSPTIAPTVTPTATIGPTPTATATATGTPNPTATATATATVNPTGTPSATATINPSATPSPSASPTINPTPTGTPLISPTPSATPSSTQGVTTTPSATSSPSGTPLPSATPTPSATPANLILLNISGRTFVQTGDKVGIGGFIVRGTGFKRVIARAIGPSLAVAGVPGTLQDPLLELHDSHGGTITNDNWRSTQEAEIQATGLAPTDDRESAIIVVVPAGAYTAIIRGATGGIGVGLIEIYDLGSPFADEPEMKPEEPEGQTFSELGNLSVRADVRTDANVLIDGVIMRGEVPKRVLFRALGPSLATSGVQGTLQDPTLELHDGNGALLSSNDDWRDAPNAAEIEATGIPPSDDRESAILMTLPPGNYTTITSGVSRTTGIALNEVYKLDN